MVQVSLIKAALAAAARWLLPEAGASVQVPVRACFKHVFDGLTHRDMDRRRCGTTKDRRDKCRKPCTRTDHGRQLQEIAMMSLAPARTFQTSSRLAIALVLNAVLLPALPAFGADLSQRRAPPPPPTFVALQQGGLYFGMRQALIITDKTQFSSGGGATTFESTYAAGRQLGVLVGYGFGPILGGISARIELEGSYGNPGIAKHKVINNGVDISPGKTDSFGELRSYTGLVNGYLDFNLGQTGAAGSMPWLAKVTPFIGAGIGVSQVTLRRQGISATGVLMDGTDTRMTWQGSVGVSYAIFDKTNLEIGYRHIRTEGLEFAARDGTTSKTNLVNNMVTVGIRRSF
jgi:opacity protein-like surface antigen